jgi:hypothetical protein
LREKAHEIEVLIGNWQIAQRFILIFVQLSYWQKKFFVFLQKTLDKCGRVWYNWRPVCECCRAVLSIVQTVQNFPTKFVQPVHLTMLPKCAWSKCEQIVNK